MNDSHDSAQRPRSSHIYDDRDADTVASLCKGMNKVAEGPAPKLTFFVVPRLNDPDEKTGTYTCVDLDVVCYARIDLLSKDLQAKVREELGPLTVPTK